MIEIKHRYSDSVLYRSESATTIRKAAAEAVNAGADLAGADLVRANLARAYLAGANLAGAYLAGADLAGADLAGADLVRADLAGADLAGANLARANLAGANLARADLAGADLAGANLAGAYLAGANLGKQWIIQGSTRADGYAFFLQQLTADAEPMIKAGCRYFTVSAAIAHWLETRSGTPLGQESLAIVRQLVELARIRGKITRETELALLSTWQSGEAR